MDVFAKLKENVTYNHGSKKVNTMGKRPRFGPNLYRCFRLFADGAGKVRGLFFLLGFNLYNPNLPIFFFYILDISSLYPIDNMRTLFVRRYGIYVAYMVGIEK